MQIIAYNDFTRSQLFKVYTVGTFWVAIFFSVANDTFGVWIYNKFLMNNNKSYVLYMNRPISKSF